MRSRDTIGQYAVNITWVTTWDFEILLLIYASFSYIIVINGNYTLSCTKENKSLNC